MTKAEGIRRLQVGERVLRRSVAAGLTALGLSILAGAVIGSHDAQEIFVAIGVVLMMLCMVIGGITNSRVRCAKCGRQLQAIPAQIAVATGHCGYCGEEAFENVKDENLKGNL